MTNWRFYWEAVKGACEDARHFARTIQATMVIVASTFVIVVGALRGKDGLIALPFVAVLAALIAAAFRHAHRFYRGEFDRRVTDRRRSLLSDARGPAGARKRRPLL